MPAQWTGDIVGQMHIAGISKKLLAEYMGCSPEYISMVLNGKREPQGAEERFRQAVEELCREAASATPPV